MRLRWATFASLAAVILAPAASEAHSVVRSGGGLVSYLSEDATSLNTLTVRPDQGRIEFHDPTVDNGMDAGPCMPGQTAGGFIIQVFCETAGVSRVRIDLRDREDTALVSVPIAVTLLGGSASDRLTAGPANDEVDAGDGNDSADGGSGDDVIDGGLGLDTLAGGPGADRLVSRDGLADSIACGDGTDSVDADTVDDVAADCEQVSRTFTPPPSGAAGDEPGPPKLQVGAETVQRPGASRRVRVFATSSEAGEVSASGFLNVGGINRPIKATRSRVEVGGAGVAVEYQVPRKRWGDVAKAIRRGRTVSVRLGVVATDLAGNSSKGKAPRVRLALKGGPKGGKGAKPRAPATRHPEPGDADGDNIFDYPPYPPPYDNCPTVKNGGQLDTDGDGQGDACDADDDNDGVTDASDNCRVDANPGQEDTNDDGYGDACPPVHSDTDGIIDDDDNCDFVANPGQQDIDGDDRGDLCDNDDDGDTLDDGFDKCPTVYDPPVADVDGDGAVTWRDQPDADRDGIGTACDPDERAIDPNAQPPDTAPADARARAERYQRPAQLDAGVIVTIRCSEACAATSEVIVRRATAKRLGLGRNRTIAGGSAELDGAGKTYAFVTAPRRVRVAIADANVPVRARLVTGVADLAGNARRLSQAITIAAR